jgi:hypothetical protein
MKYIIKKGNNDTLIKSILANRVNWKESKNYLGTSYNFKWQPTKHRIEYCLLNRNSTNIKVNIQFIFILKIIIFRWLITLNLNLKFLIKNGYF